MWQCPLCFAKNAPKAIKDNISNAPDVSASLEFVEMFAKDYVQSDKHWEDKTGPPLPDCATQWRWIGDVTAAPPGESDFLFGGGELDVGRIKQGRAVWSGNAAASDVIGGLCEALCGLPSMTRCPPHNPNPNPLRSITRSSSGLAIGFSLLQRRFQPTTQQGSSASTSISLEALSHSPLLFACLMNNAPAIIKKRGVF